jgi:hypothetical protein
VCLNGVLLAAAFPQDASRSSGWVVIPVREYNELHSVAYPPAPEPELAPMDATLSRIDYEMRVADGIASGRATLTVDVLKNGYVRVPIPSGLLVRQATLEGKPLSLINGAALLAKKGRSSLDLDIAIPVARTGPVEQVMLPASASGVTRAKLDIAAHDMDLNVTGGILAEESEGSWVAYASGAAPLTFSWKRKVEERREELPLRMRGSLVELAALGEDSSAITAEVGLDVTQGAAHEVRLHIPEGVTINQVPGAAVSDWDVKDGVLTVSFLDPVEHSAAFTIQGEAHLARDGGIDVPILRLEGAERETGGVAVDLIGPAEIKQWQPLGFETAEASELGASIAQRQSPSLAAFRLRAGASARSLHIEVARYAQQQVLTANVEEARYRVLMSADGKTLVQARYAVRNNQRNFVKVALPAGATVWSSTLEGHPVRPGSGPDGSLLFPLSKARAGEEAPVFAIEVLYLAPSTAWAERGSASLTLPALDLPVSRTGVSLYYPPLYHVSPEPGAFRLQEYERPAATALNNTAPVTPAPPPQLPPGGGPGGFGGSGNARRSLTVDYLARNATRRAAAPLPLQVAFPAVGPSIYLVSELTAENQAAKLDITYQKDKRGGVK